MYFLIIVFVYNIFIIIICFCIFALWDIMEKNRRSLLPWSRDLATLWPPRRGWSEEIDTCDLHYSMLQVSHLKLQHVALLGLKLTLPSNSKVSVSKLCLRFIIVIIFWFNLIILIYLLSFCFGFFFTFFLITITQ